LEALHGCPVLGSSSWMPCVPQGVKETDDNDDDKIILLRSFLSIWPEFIFRLR
jgi:hypothetical protein